IEVPLVLQDWTDCPAADYQARLEDFLLRDRQRQFSPWTPPLWRVTLFRLTPQLSHCVLSFHHAILDGRSCALVLNEVALLYRELVSAPPDAADAGSALAPVRSYQAYASWWHARDPLADERFWQLALADFAAPLALPEVQGPGVAREQAGAAHAEEDLVLPPALSQALRQLAQAQQLTI